MNDPNSELRLLNSDRLNSDLRLLNSDLPNSVAFEDERRADGALVPTGIVFLKNRRCPFHCVMCDLGTHMVDATVPVGVIPAQIRTALGQMAPVRQVKLYNSGSFFDPGAVPPADDEAIARLVGGFERVIVESHPAFLAGGHGQRCLRFRDRLDGRLEVAVGLETANAEVLARLDKGMTLDDFRRAAGFLAAHGIDLRVFVLLDPPFLPWDDAVEWACRSIDLAAECGATACSLIPLRGRGGAVEAPPAARLPALERAVEYGIGRGPMRVFADLWDIERLSACACAPRRVARLQAMNREQRVPPPVHCDCHA